MNTTPKSDNAADDGSDQRIVLPLRVIDLDSPFFFGVGRDMTDEERANAERHGRSDNPPMSVLGITSEGLAAVEGEDLARMFAAAPELLECLIHLADRDWFREGVTGRRVACHLDPDKVRNAVRKALGQNH